MGQLVYSFDQLEECLGETSQFTYLKNYLAALNCSQIVFEDKYVDKEYLIDYVNFHARSFAAPERLTQRFHFFAMPFSEKELRDALKTGDEEFAELLSKNYLGFTICKPVKNTKGKFLIGRTVLKPYPSDIEGSQDKRIFVTTRQHISLFGIPLKIDSLPYQAQDTAVGACSSTALWTSLFAMREYGDAPLLALAEITAAATQFPGPQRRFPSSGLTLSQILSFWGTVGAEVEVANVASESSLACDFIKAYIRCGVPVIATLALKKTDIDKDYHAVVISGYRQNINGKLVELFVHDDQIGPYSRVLPLKDATGEDFCIWDNEWTIQERSRQKPYLKKPYKQVELQKLIAPLYPKMRLSFSLLYQRFRRWRKRVEAMKLGAQYELFLYPINKYKQELRQSYQTFTKVDVLTTSMPRFVWVMRMYSEGSPALDILYDATLPYPSDKPLKKIRFDQDKYTSVMANEKKPERSFIT